jgi:hypothetical protein
MHFRTAIACAVILLGSAATSGAQTVSLQFDNGNVTVNAQNARSGRFSRNGPVSAVRES